MRRAANGNPFPERSGHSELDYHLHLTGLHVGADVVEELGRQVPPDGVVLALGRARRAGSAGVVVFSNTALTYCDAREGWTVPYNDMQLFDQVERGTEWLVLFTAYGRAEQVTLLDRRSPTLRQAVDYVVRQRGILASEPADPPADDAPQG